MGGESAPLTERGRRTRQQLLDAAAEVFAERQFLDTKVSDIVKRAGVAHGTFYRYFESKDEVFREVGSALQQVMLAAADGRHDPLEAVPDLATPAELLLWRVTRANRRYLQAYQEHRELLAVMEQVATISGEMRELRRLTRQAFIGRIAHTLERLQRDGLTRRDFDPRYAASALGSMVDRFAYVWLVLDEPFELEEAARTLSLLWCRSIGLDIPERTRAV